jgi:hypothetical protein
MVIVASRWVLLLLVCLHAIRAACTETVFGVATTGVENKNITAEVMFD